MDKQIIEMMDWELTLLQDALKYGLWIGISSADYPTSQQLFLQLYAKVSTQRNSCQFELPASSIETLFFTACEESEPTILRLFSPRSEITDEGQRRHLARLSFVLVNAMSFNQCKDIARYVGRDDEFLHSWMYWAG